MTKMPLMDMEKIALLYSDVGDDNAPMLLRVFIQELLEYEQALTVEEYPEQHCRAICHALKSNAASFGAAALLAQATMMDKAIKQKQPINLDSEVDSLVALIKQTQWEYERFLAQ